ncbi:hypothetical protein ABW21_db0202191 [Orbilia brochopaga]|nr:hypothetical protein ABW21_db0202191 [Drechslerella brochopaga]
MASQAPLTITSLSTEILHKFGQYLSADDLCSIRQASKNLNIIFKSPHLDNTFHCVTVFFAIPSLQILCEISQNDTVNFRVRKLRLDISGADLAGHLDVLEPDFSQFGGLSNVISLKRDGTNPLLGKAATDLLSKAFAGLKNLEVVEIYNSRSVSNLSFKTFKLLSRTLEDGDLETILPEHPKVVNNIGACPWRGRFDAEAHHIFPAVVAAALGNNIRLKSIRMPTLLQRPPSDTSGGFHAPFSMIPWMKDNLGDVEKFRAMCEHLRCLDLSLGTRLPNSPARIREDMVTLFEYLSLFAGGLEELRITQNWLHTDGHSRILWSEPDASAMAATTPDLPTICLPPGTHFCHLHTLLLESQIMPFNSLQELLVNANNTLRSLKIINCMTNDPLVNWRLLLGFLEDSFKLTSFRLAPAPFAANQWSRPFGFPPLKLVGPWHAEIKFELVNHIFLEHARTWRLARPLLILHSKDWTDDAAGFWKAVLDDAD